jgi:hypothetical protein
MEIEAQVQIELNKKYGKRLVALAWAIEIIAASIGFFIGFNQAQQSVRRQRLWDRYRSGLRESFCSS